MRSFLKKKQFKKTSEHSVFNVFPRGFSKDHFFKWPLEN